MKIRTAVPADLAVIVDFNIKLARESEGLGLEVKTVTAGVAAVLKDQSKGIYFVADMSGTVVGQLMITHEWSDWRNGDIWWIQSVYVQEAHRGSGIFKELFRHVEMLARKSGEVCSLRLYLEKHNDRARRAYQKMGMSETAYDVMEFALSASAAG